MINGQFDVIFRGQTIKSMELTDVKANLVGVFKSSPEAVEKLFSGKEVTIKKSLDYSTAMKYQSALKKAGALALIKEVESEVNDNPSTDSTADNSQIAAKTGIQQNVSQNNAASSRGAVTFGPTEAKEPSTENVTTDEAHVTNTSNLAETQEDGMTLAAAGEQILPDKKYEKRNVDTSDLSLAAAGERILPKSAPENHPQPSIDHLSLED